MKKNEKTRVRARPASDDGGRGRETAQEESDSEGADDDAEQNGEDGMSRSVRSPAGGFAVAEGAQGDAEDPATMRIDFKMPKMPAVAMAPTPT